jgi:hypothetical protein
MYFRLSPLLIRKNIRIEASKTTRTLNCSTRMNTYSENWKPNILSDGAKIESLGCAISVHCMGEGDFTPEKGHESLLFYSPEYSGKYDFVPANFHLQVYLSSSVFNELWQMVHNDRSVIFDGEIARSDLTVTSHNPIRGGSTYEWDVNETMKIVSPLSFRMAKPSEVHDSMPTKLTEKYREEYKDYSQMLRLLLDVFRQTENEAQRRGVEMKRTGFEGAPDVISYLESLYHTAKNDKQELWWHKDVDSLGECNLGYEQATDLLTCLLECPWLRCDELEWAVTDYLIFWETSGFNDQMKATPRFARWSSKKVQAARSLLFDVAFRMKQAYFCMRPLGVLSPYQIRNALLHAQCAGAAWHPTVFAILDRAVRRDPPVWMVPK